MEWEDVSKDNFYGNEDKLWRADYSDIWEVFVREMEIMFESELDFPFTDEEEENGQ